MKKPVIIVIALILVLFAALCAYQAYRVEVAHSTFDNYYAFRGCTQLLTKTDTSATCSLASGQVITIVQVNNKWYLDGDLPVCYWGNSLCL